MGALCPPDTNKAVEGVVGDYHKDVSCSWAYMRRDALSHVRHNFSPPWFPAKTTQR
jgi:hypothetical protein